MKKLVLLILIFGVMGVVSAHEADCPYCAEKIVQNTDKQDNEVVVKVGNKRIEYRCLYCVIKDQRRYKGDLVVYAPSEKVGSPVVIKRTGGKWVGPEKMVVLNVFKKHTECAALSRAFSTREALDAYVKRNNVQNAKALSLKEFIELVEKPVQK
ncbi:MAG: hypothetical protein IT205_06300 [Fimbriimonadaceae bacterium]|jgi:hypothetical protein|nr:hypothetical protein [Fimbriimonadaceae bacterium]